MITREEARAAADRWINGDRPEEERKKIGLYEFDLGYVVWGMQPAAEDPTRPPATFGAARGVIDKETGELSQWPSIPATMIADQYRRRREASQRFPDDVLPVLRAAGWAPRRNVRPEIERWQAGFSQRMSDEGRRHEPVQAALAVLYEFGGLTVEQHGAGESMGLFTFQFYPAVDWWPDPDSIAEFSRDIGQRVFPVGVHGDDGADIVVGEDGRVYLLHWAGDFILGRTIDEALAGLIRGVRPGELFLEPGKTGEG